MIVTAHLQCRGEGLHITIILAKTDYFRHASSYNVHVYQCLTKSG